MKLSLLSAVTHFAAVILGGIVILLASGCSVPTESPGFEQTSVEVHAPALLPAPPPATTVTVDSCASFQGSWALQAPRCPAGYSAISGECAVFGEHAVLIASGFQGPDSWGCQATNRGATSFSICAHVICQ